MIYLYCPKFTKESEFRIRFWTQYLLCSFFWDLVFEKFVKNSWNFLSKTFKIAQNKAKPVKQPTARVLQCNLLLYESLVYSWLAWMEITQNIDRQTVVAVQKLRVRRIILTNHQIMGSTRENVMWTIKLICWCRMLLIKTIFRILKYLLKLYSS